MPSGLIDRLQHISSFTNKGASRIICEDMKLLEMMPRMFKVMERVAKYSCTHVKHGRWSCSRLGKAMIVTRAAGGRFYVYQETVKDINKALTKIIKYFSRAVDVEALHFTNESGASLLLVRPSQSIEAPIGRLPAEIWQDILLLAIGSNGYPTFATTCTTSTFLHFLEQEKDPCGSYLEYVGRWATLRQVCRAWNEFLESTETWWVHAKDPYHPQTSFDLPPIADQVAIVKRLSMTITVHKCVVPALAWASDLFQRVQAPILSYNIKLEVRYPYEPYDLLAPVTTKMALRSLRIACRSEINCEPILLSQINTNFKNLVSLSLSGVTVRSTEELTLPRLEFLYIESTLPTKGWDLPRLRHVYLARMPSATNFHMLINSVRRYASQLESLFLARCPPLHEFPADFWDTFPVLRLFGLPYDVLHYSWGGWKVQPPQSHPLRYLVCGSSPALVETANELKWRWKYHNGVALVIQGTAGVYYLIEDAKKMEWSRETNGILSWTPGSYFSRIPERSWPDDSRENYLRG